MTADRWTRLERIYHAALEQPERDRAAFVQREAGGDVELAAEIEALLHYDGRPAAFTQHSAIDLMARTLASEHDDSGAAPSETIGSYQILRLLGAGGMGDVYLARDRRLARNVALKLLRPDPGGPGWLAAFRNEAFAASALNHPNIMTIYEVGEHDGTRFIAAEYADGLTLRQRLKDGPMAAREVVDVGLQIAEGLAAAHAAGVVHRDIKPDNIMVRADGLVKILDFGIATRAGTGVPFDHDAGGGGAVVGTTAYMSPEQRQGAAVEPGMDLWSLGIVIREMASGCDYPGGLTAIVDRALSPDRVDRYSTAQEMARDLRAVRRELEHPSADAVSTGLPARQRLIRRGHPLYWFGALSLVAAAVYLMAVATRSPATGAITSIGVMSLENAGGIRDGEYLADGIAASLRSRLSRFSSIHQAAGSEAARFQRLGLSAAQAGREMGVAAVLTGVLERRAETLIVRLELLRSSDGAALWKRQFVRPAGDLMTLQTEITRELVEALGISSPPLPLGGDDTRDPGAYQLYLKGRYHVQRRTPDDLRKGLDVLRQAAALDPEYGRVHATLAEAHILLAMTSDVAPKNAFPEARTAAERALEIDPGLSEARVSMGLIKFWFDWDWSGAEVEFRRAIAAVRPDPAAHVFYGHLLSNLGDHTRALQEMRRALDYEPHSPLANALFAQCLYYEGRDDESLAHLEKTRTLDPAFWLTYNMMGRIYGRRGMHREALLAFDRATERGGSLVVKATAAYTLASIGRRDEARDILDQLRARAAQAYVPPSNLALVHVGLGEQEAALDRLEEAVEARDLLVTFLGVEPRWRALAGHPRFTTLLAKVGLK